MKPKVLVITGLTATGKSDLAVHLAKKHKGEVISADSRQVYTGLDIGTGKITKKEMRGVPHHLLDVENPRKKFSVVKYVEHAERAIGQIVEKGRLPIIAGGTGFYIQALIDGIILPEVPPDAKLRKELAKKSAKQLFAMLKKIDPKRAAKIDPLNIRRIIRAIEIAKALGKVPSIKTRQKYNPLFIALHLNKAELQEKIRARLEKRLKKGMIAEAKKLHERGLSFKRMEELGLEYRYLSYFLQKKMTREKMAEKLNTEIWNYAKRQLTWFKRDARITWYTPDEAAKIEALVKKFLR